MEVFDEESHHKQQVIDLVLQVLSVLVVLGIRERLVNPKPIRLDQQQQRIQNDPWEHLRSSQRLVDMDDAFRLHLHMHELVKTQEISDRQDDEDVADQEEVAEV